MKRYTILALLAGLAAVTALVVWQGAEEVARAFRELGFGILLLLPVYFLHLAISVVSFRYLFPAYQIPALIPLFNALWIGGAVNTVFPVAQVGGEAVKARVLHYYGSSGPVAACGALADTTVAALSLALWGFVGVGSLFYLGVDPKVAAGVLAGVAAFSAGVFAFFVLQRIGAVGFLAKFVSRISGTKGWGTMVDNVKDVDVAVREVYGDQIRFWWSVFVRLLARFAMSLEVWLAAYLMGHPIGLIEAFMFRSLIATVRGAAFFVPQGLGVQEAAFIVLGGLVGVPPGIALSISLATRVRELIESFTGILLWQHLEGKSLWALFRNGKQG
ncbi:MAG: lysylphosphatidylglycerol synthase domain-containing protein [Rhodospirillales bacterium]